MGLGLSYSMGLTLGSGGGGGLPSSIKSKLLFLGYYSQISGGKMPNTLGNDWLTVSGSAGSETYQAPNTSTYRSADSDELWMNWAYENRTVTTAELIGYDFSRTLVHYLDNSPNSIVAIAIIKSGETLTESEINEVHKYFRLSIYWSGTPNAYGYLKSNRGLSRSVFTPDANIIKTDTYSLAWYKPNDVGGRKESLGVEEIYYDMLVGSSSFGSVLTSGSTVAYTVYKIVTTTANYFFTGCQVGDIFAENSSKGLNALNSVRVVNGNHLCQGTVAKRPTNQIFSAHAMKTKAFTFNQPAFFYVVLKQISWTAGKYIYDGAGAKNSMMQQVGTTPKIIIHAGTDSSQNANLAVGSVGVVRAYYNGASSKLIVNETTPTTGDFGSKNPGGFTIGSQADGVTSPGNFQFYEAILRTSNSGEAQIYNYLKVKYGL